MDCLLFMIMDNFTIYDIHIKVIILLMYSPEKKVRLPSIGSKSRSSPGKSNGPLICNDIITAKAWLYWTPNSTQGFKANAKQGLASVTKVMTSICTLELCERFGMALKTTYFKVTGWAAAINGTSAQLQEGAWMSIEDLLYGLMLPSGNDAASVLCQNLGAVLYFDKTGNQELVSGRSVDIQVEIRSIDLSDDYESVRQYTTEFMACMNTKAKKLGMSGTYFGNPHGMDQPSTNYSSCQDILKMCQYAMEIPVFRTVVRTASHRGVFKFHHNGTLTRRAITWSNTNKLLGHSGIFGIKTGITSKAGGCLTTAFEMGKGQEGYIVVLGCKSTEDRFRDTLKVMNLMEEDTLASTS